MTSDLKSDHEIAIRVSAKNSMHILNQPEIEDIRQSRRLSSFDLSNSNEIGKSDSAVDLEEENEAYI